MGLQENLLKGIYQYGNYSYSSIICAFISALEENIRNLPRSVFIICCSAKPFFFFEGLEKPSAVHQRGIVPLCKGSDVLHRSLSGTTETICSGVLQRLDYGSAECQALILVPTPGLAQETLKVLEALGQFLGVTAQTCTGGTSAHADQQALLSGAQVLVGTPDCILDMLQKHALCPDHVRMLFLDEADELLTGGSKDQVSFITYQLCCSNHLPLLLGASNIECMIQQYKVLLC